MSILPLLLLVIGLGLAAMIYFGASRTRLRLVLVFAVAGFAATSWLSLRSSQRRVEAWTARRNWHCNNVARHLDLMPVTAKSRFEDARADLRATILHGLYSDLLFCLPRDAVDACSDAAWAGLGAESAEQLRGQLTPIAKAIETGGACR